MKNWQKATLAICITTILTATIAYAVILKQKTLPGYITVNGVPNIIVCNGASVEYENLDFGTKDRGQSNTRDIFIKNTGDVALYILTNSFTNTLSTTVGSLTWNFADLYPSGYVELSASQMTTQITLTLSILETSPAGSFSFDLTFTAYSTPTG